MLDGKIYVVGGSNNGQAVNTMDCFDIDTVLRPFEQVDSALSRKYEGIGLGLPLSKSFVELHGGSLEIQSELGVGTTAIVRLPKVRIGADGGALRSFYAAEDAANVADTLLS